MALAPRGRGLAVGLHVNFTNEARAARGVRRSRGLPRRAARPVRPLLRADGRAAHPPRLAPARAPPTACVAGFRGAGATSTACRCATARRSSSRAASTASGSTACPSRRRSSFEALDADPAERAAAASTSWRAIPATSTPSSTASTTASASTSCDARGPSAAARSSTSSGSASSAIASCRAMAVGHARVDASRHDGGDRWPLSRRPPAGPSPLALALVAGGAARRRPRPCTGACPESTVGGADALRDLAVASHAGRPLRRRASASWPPRSRCDCVRRRPRARRWAGAALLVARRRLRPVRGGERADLRVPALAADVRAALPGGRHGHHALVDRQLPDARRIAAAAAAGGLRASLAVRVPRGAARAGLAWAPRLAARRRGRLGRLGRAGRRTAAGATATTAHRQEPALRDPGLDATELLGEHRAGRRATFPSGRSPRRTSSRRALAARDRVAARRRGRAT